MKRFLIIIFCCVVATVCVVAVILSGIFANEDEIQLAFSNSILQSYDMPTENGKYVLYYSQEAYYEQAFNNGKACQVYFSVLVNSGASNKFIFSLSNSNIILDSENRILTGGADGDCKLTLTAKDGSGASKCFDFIVKEYTPQITPSNEECFVFSLEENFDYGGKIMFDTENLVYSLNCGDFDDDISVVITVSLGNIENPSDIFDTYSIVEDIYKIVKEVNVGVGGNSVVPITIILQKSAGTVVVRFTNSDLGLEEEITIIVS